MATFQCQTCGNLHGAPVAECGVCKSPAVMLVPDDTKPPNPPTAPGIPGATPPAAAAPNAANADEFLAALKQVIEPGLEYIKQRDADRFLRDDAHDTQEQQRRDALNHAKLEFFGQSTTLIEKLTELAESAVTYVDTLVMKAKAPPPAP